MNKLLFLIAAIAMSLLVAVGAAFAFAPEPHVHEYASETTEATCTVDGATVYTCECGDSYTEKIPALGHTEETVEGKNATCLEAGITDGKKCTVCGETLVAQETIAALGHKMVTDEAVAPTCTDTGLSEGSHCSRCDYKVAQEVVPALGHDMVVDEAVPATCNDTGLSEGAHCSRCDHKVEQEVVPALGHDVKIIAAVKPTCTETGLRQGYYCSRCDGYNIKQDVVPALGHAYDDIYDETCNTCGHVRDAACHHTNKVAVGEAKEPTCTEAGITEGVKCSECDEILEPQEIREKLGHDPVHHEAKAPTCTEIGWDAYETCSRCDYTTYAEKSALDHDRISHEAKAPTCTEIGWYAYETCSRCDYTTYVEIAALGHNHQPAVTEPTCTEIGYTTYTCSACGDNYRADEVAALGHSYGAWSLATEPTYATEGALSKTCGICSHVDTKNIGVVSADNGYTLVITGVLSRWQYALDGQTFTFDITETVDTTDGKNTYSDDATAWYCGFDASGAMVKLDGYKTTNAAWDGTNRSFGGRNMTYITTIVAPEDTTVTLVLNCARNKVKPFFNDGVEWVLNWIKVNGSEDGVIYDTTSTLNKTGWHNYNDYAIATLFLKEGKNVISLQSSTTVNIKGIGFISSETIHIHTDVIDNAVAPTCLATGLTEGVHCSECNKVLVAQETVPSGGHSWSEAYTVLTAPTYTSEGSMAKKCTVCDVASEEIVAMPAVSVENGYTKTLDGVISRWEYSYNGTYTIVDVVESKEFDNYFFSANDAYNEGLGSHNSTYNAGGYFGDTSGDVFTTYITVSEATSVNFIIRGGTKDTRSYSGATIVSSLTINGKTDGVVLTTELTKFQGWTNWVEFHAATLYLEEGVNIIKFSLSSNLNIAGISFDSAKEVSLVTDYVNLDFMSFNIRQDTDSGVKAWANRKDALIASILAHNPSVICFQEVKKNQYEDIAAGLASASYEVVWYGRQSGSNPEGLAIAYKTDTWTKQSDRVFWLSDTPDVMSKGWDDAYYRICVNVLLKHNASGEMLDVYTVHLGLTETSRKNGMQLILDRVTGSYPTYIAGDFNCTNTMDAYLITAEKYVDCQIAAPTTEFDDTFQGWGSQVGDGKNYIIDFCFVSGKHFAPVTFDICQDKWGENNANYLSDHYALMTKVAMLIPHVHTEEIDEAVEATCTTEGKTQGKHCSTCGEVLVAQTVVNALGHSEVVDSAVEADCDSTGKTEGKHCSVCGEILVPQTVIDALGHAYDDDTDESCNRCDFIRDVSCAHTNKVAISEAKDATCTEPGNTAGEKCADCGEVFVEQEIFQPTGHTAITDAAVAPTCINTGLTEGSHCSVCGEVFVAQNLIDALGHTNGAAVIENETAPTVTAAGSADIVVYCSVCNTQSSRETILLPSLNTVDYTTETTLAGTTATTVFTYNSDSISYSVSLTSTKYISVNNQVYSPYDVAKLNDGNVAVSFDDTNGFVYYANTEHTITQISTNGCSLTLTGNVVINSSASITFVGGNFNVGTDSTVANVTINSSVDLALLISSGSYKIIVNKGSSLAVNLDNASWMAVRFSHRETCNLNVYGTFTTNGVLSGNRYHAYSVYEGGSFTCGAYNNGQGHEIRVEGGVMNVTGNLAQTKNSKVTVAAGGTLNVGGTLKVADAGGVLTVNGTVNVGGSITNAATFTIGETGRCYVTGTANKAPTVTDGGYALIGGTSYGTAPAASEEVSE